MAMTTEQYEEMVRTFEAQAERDPKGYRLRVGAFAVLGYAYILIILGILLTLCAVMGWVIINHGLNYGTIKITIALGIVTLLMLQALWVKIPPPEGIALTRESVPKLYAMLDELSSKLNAPKFHHVLLDGDFNAAAGQLPRLGIFGWYRSYLFVGMPLMQAMSPEQFRAVMAHELGHLSGNHGRFGAWIYRQRKTWAQIIENFASENEKGFFTIFHAFLKWYIPRFMAYSFVLGRAQEYEADRAAAEAATAQAIGDALIVLQVQDKHHDAYWKEIYEVADKSPDPPANAFTGMSRALRKTADTADLAVWMDRALSVKTDLSDTHPSLTDRLKAMGRLPENVDPVALVPSTPTQSAAEFYFGNALNHFLERLDLEWQRNIAPLWQQRFEYAQESQKQLGELDAKAQAEPLTEEEAFIRARLTEQVRGKEAALGQWQALTERLPDSNPARYGLGRSLLAAKDRAGIALVEGVMEREPEAVEPGCDLIYEFLSENGTQEEVEAFRDKARVLFERLEEAAKERKAVTPKDTLLSHDLPVEQLQALAVQLAQNSQVKAALLVRKQVNHYANQPMYVLGIVQNYKWYQFRSDDASAKLVNELAENLQFDGYLHIIALDGTQKKMRRTLESQPNSLIYQRR
jgi:Zn-dependent protease with chaperone function